MKIKTSTLIGPALDWAVMVARKRFQFTPQEFLEHQARYPQHCYQRYFEEGGRLLSNNRISRTIDHSGLWLAYDYYNYADSKQYMQCHSSELVAGLRCYVARELGDEVEIPAEILAQAQS